MKRMICKGIVYLFFLALISFIYALLLFKDKEATTIILAIMGVASIGGYIVKIVEWLFKSEVAENE